MYAVVNTGGKQAKVEQGSILAVEKLDAEVGTTVSLPVLMVADGDRILAKPDEIAGASVTAEILEHFKGEKLIVFKFKKRKGYKRTQGHRQSLTSIRVLDIAIDGAPTKSAKAAKAKAEPVAKKAEKVVKAPVAKKAEKVVEAPAAKKAEKVVKAPVAAKTPATPVVKTSVAETAQCAAIKSDGTQCTNKAKDGSKYCGVHAKYEA